MTASQPKQKGPRKHHFLPRFYLRGFSTSGEDDGDLCVLSRKDGHKWKGTPATIGYECDFYRVEDISGLDPEAVEKMFSAVEPQLAANLRQILSDEDLPPPTSHEFGVFLNLIAGMIVRVPSAFETLARFEEGIAEAIARTVVETPEHYQAIVAAAQEEDKDFAVVEYERMRSFIEEKRYRVDVPRARLIKHMLDSLDVVLQLLAARKWVAFVATDGAGNFITSDNPVAVGWSKPRPPSFYPPALGVGGTDVTFPLSRRMAVLGRLEGPAGRAAADRRIVASINTRTALASRRFICSAREGFDWVQSDGAISGAADLIKQIPPITSARSLRSRSATTRKHKTRDSG